jgi:hypothetical protein
MRGRQPGGVGARLLRFFADNPHEELTMADMQLKFGCGSQTLRSAIRNLRRDGAVIECLTLYRAVKVPEA